MAANNQNILSPGHILQSPNYAYRIESVLGCGGFGITYLASATIKVGNVSVKAQFAIKEHFMSGDCEREHDTNRVSYSNPARERVENSRKDFVAEAHRLHKVGVDHHNIVKVNEVFEANNTAYYVMEYIDGKSLRSYVKNNGPLDKATLIKIMGQIVDAVKYLHANLMTHLDIKPENIMLTKDDNGDIRPVLIDFGLSKHYDKDGQPTSTINTLGCSDGYAPMEQYAGITTFSPSADYYALGATMWYCLTGKDPKKSTELMDDELANSLPEGTAPEIRNAIAAACNPNRHNRRMPDITGVENNNTPYSPVTPNSPTSTGGETATQVISSAPISKKVNKNKSSNTGTIAMIAIAVVVGGAVAWFMLNKNSDKSEIAQAQEVEIIETDIEEKQPNNEIPATPGDESIDTKPGNNIATSATTAPTATPATSVDTKPTQTATTPAVQEPVKPVAPVDDPHSLEHAIEYLDSHRDWVTADMAAYPDIKDLNSQLRTCLHSGKLNISNALITKSKTLQEVAKAFDEYDKVCTKYNVQPRDKYIRYFGTASRISPSEIRKALISATTTIQTSDAAKGRSL